MPSKSREVRESQKKHFETSITTRRAFLKEQGLEAATMKKDPRLKQLRAKLSQINKSLKAITDLEKQNEALALRKKEKAENPVVKEKSRGKKSASSKDEGSQKAQKGNKKDKKKK